MRKILVICDYHGYGNNANTIWDHVTAFGRYSSHQVTIVSTKDALPEALDFDWFDALVLHYSVNPLHFLHGIKERIARFSGLKILFVQDEYQKIFDLNKEMALLKIDVLFSCLTPDLFEVVYPKHALPSLSIYPVLTGYVPERLLRVERVPMAERPVDVFYRGRDLSYWYGGRSREKSEIVRQIEPHLAAAGLRYDLGAKEHERIYGDEWIARLKNSKATLGVESGVSVFDFTGEIARSVQAYLERRPEATFEEVRAHCFAGHDGLLSLSVISPRCFEAAALKTAMILYEGHYSGLLVPDRHYIPLKKDGSNVAEVIAKLRDLELLTRLTETAYNEIALAPANSYAESVKQFDTVCEAELARRNRRPAVDQSGAQIASFFCEPACIALEYDGVPIYFPKEIVAASKKFKISHGEIFYKKRFLRWLLTSMINGLNRLPAGGRSMIKRIFMRLKVLIGFVSDNIR